MYTCQYVRYLSKKNKHKNFGRLRAINLEQLDKLLESLKTYWNYDISTSSMLAIEKPVVQLEYEL